jgi:hypothetical protein
MIMALPIYFVEAFVGYVYPIYFTLEITLKSNKNEPITQK